MSRKTREHQKQRQAAGDNRPAPLQLKSINPITKNQSGAFKAYFSGANLLLHGYAGTGKTFQALYLALNDVMTQEDLDRVVIVRSAVPSRAQGFLPGDEAEKYAIYESAYRDIVGDLFGRASAYNVLKDAKIIDFRTTSYLRGITLDHAVIVIDEVQNMTDGEINTIMTRVGEGSRVIICGDFRQNDLENKRYEESGIYELLDTIGRMKSFETVEFGIQDIVRSGLVKEWIVAREGV
jgi:phosphate starvation-inducible protein PhoH